MRVMASLRDAIGRSKYESKHLSSNAIKVANVSNYVELATVNDALTFLDADGNHYGVFADCSLEDLIDILENI